MKRLFHLAITLLVSAAMLMTACKKDETNNENNNSSSANQETHILPNAVTDIDGNTYDAVQLGNQVWMAENLRTTRYANGTTIPLGTSTSTYTAYRYVPGPNQSSEENMVNVAQYGYLYNWPAVMHGASESTANPSGVQGICPNGWHVPSDAEWTKLTYYMSTQPSYTASGNTSHLAKALAATWGWDRALYNPDAPGDDPSTNNATGFSALPACKFGSQATYWSTTEYKGPYSSTYDLYASYARTINYNGAEVLRSRPQRSDRGSVRCVRD